MKASRIVPAMLVTALSVVQTNAAPPNIIYILLDDQPYDMMPHSERYPFLNMPNVQQLQNEGVTFNNFFCVHSISSPSRACNLTGTYPHINGVTQNLGFVDPNWEKTPNFGTYLQKGGYQTAFIGKIHMAYDKAHQGKGSIRPGFDYWVSFYHQGAYYDPLMVENGVEIEKKGYITNILGQYALDWISNKREKNKPFAMCLWQKAVHAPFTPEERYSELYSDQTIAPPPYRTDQDDLSTKPVWQRIHLSRNVEYPPLSCPPKPWNRKRPSAFGQMRAIASVDDMLGDIIKLLDEEGILDNTMIIFSSDNGYFHGEHQFGDKRMVYENSIRIPMVIRYPKQFAKGSNVDHFCLNIDIAPTLLDIAGMRIPSQMQGESMKKILEKGKDEHWRRSFLCTYFNDASGNDKLQDVVCIRTEKYKYVANHFYINGKKDIDELYDLEKDPGEMINQINNPEYAQILEQLKKELDALKIKYKYNPDANWRTREVLATNPNVEL